MAFTLRIRNAPTEYAWYWYAFADGGQAISPYLGIDEVWYSDADVGWLTGVNDLTVIMVDEQRNPIDWASGETGGWIKNNKDYVWDVAGKSLSEQSLPSGFEIRQPIVKVAGKTIAYRGDVPPNTPIEITVPVKALETADITVMLAIHEGQIRGSAGDLLQQYQSDPTSIQSGQTVNFQFVHTDSMPSTQMKRDLYVKAYKGSQVAKEEFFQDQFFVSTQYTIDFEIGIPKLATARKLIPMGGDVAPGETVNIIVPVKLKGIAPIKVIVLLAVNEGQLSGQPGDQLAYYVSSEVLLSPNQSTDIAFVDVAKLTDQMKRDIQVWVYLSPYYEGQEAVKKGLFQDIYYVTAKAAVFRIEQPVAKPV